MSKYPYFPFYSGDWMKDPQLSLCSPSSRGVWIDLLCAMHENDRSGQITGTADQLSRLCRCTTVEFQAAIVELKASQTADVTIRNEIVTVICRRMKREANNRKNTALRVNHYREKKKCNAFETDLKRPCNRDISYSKSNIREEKERDTKVSLKKETAESIPLSVFPKAKLRITAQDEQDFEQFWKWYPRKINKVAAKKSYFKNAPDEKTRQQVLDAVMYQVSSGKFNLDDNMRFCPHATTWLNQKRFEDEIPPEAFLNYEEK